MEKASFKKCVNCEEELRGSYCHNCGQKRIERKDKSLKYFIEEFFSSIFVADGKILSTFKVLFFKPGELSRTYINGNRKRYLSPLRVFFFANLIYFLFPLVNTFNSNLYTQLNRQSYSELAAEIITNHLEKSNRTYEEYRMVFESKSTNIGKLLLIILVVLQALFMRLLFIRKKELLLTDFLAASAYFTSFYILVFLVIFPLLVKQYLTYFPNGIDFLNNEISTIILIIGILFYLTVFLKRAFSLTSKFNYVAAVILAFLLMPTFIIYRFTLFIVAHFLSI